MSDLAARIKDLTQRINSLKIDTELSGLSINAAEQQQKDFLFNDSEERRRQLGELQQQLAELQKQVPLPPSTAAPATDAASGATASGTYRVDLSGADAPDLPEATSFTAQPASSPPPPTQRPRTQEKPGTGAKDPKPEEPPAPDRTGASGQITDKTGEYGPVRHSDPSKRPPRVEDPDVPGSGISGRSSDPSPAGGQMTDEDGVSGGWKGLPPKPQPPQKKFDAEEWSEGRPPARPTAEITDRKGEYGPEQTWKPGTRDWNKVNRFGGTAKRVPKVVYALGIVALLALLIGTLLRPSSVSEPSGSIVSGGTAPPTSATTAPTAAPATPAPGPSAPTAASAGYRCVGGQKTLFDNSNGSVVTSGGTPATFSTNGNTYCLVSVSTYHWNGGQGATPGRIGLIGGSGNVGPVQTKSGTGVPNADWVYVPEADARPLLSGQYTCTDSDPASWSQNEASGRLGFCRVFVQDAVKP